MANTTNYNWETPDDTDLVKDGAAAIRTLGSSIDTTTKNLNPQTTTGALAYRSATANVNTALPIGTAGQILAVSGGVPAWINNDQGDITEVQAGTGISVASGTGPIPVVTNTVATAYDAKGDLIVGTGADTFSRLAVGTNNYILTADSAEATGLKWAAAAGGGKLLQLVSGTYGTLTTVTSTTMTDTGLTATITPTSASSKILIIISNPVYILQGSPATDAYGAYRIVRGSTAIDGMLLIGNTGSGASPVIQLTTHYYDSPATTSATTYKMQIAAFSTGVSIQAQYRYTSFGTSSITLMEIGA